MEYGFELTEKMLGDFALYREMLLDWNQRINLTTILDEEEMVIKHFLDSMLVLKAVNVPRGTILLDVGSGAGFPGIPLKILRPDLRVTLLDSLQKRLNFLEKLSEALKQDNILVHGRAEELSREKKHREQYELVTARAVAGMAALSEYCLPFVRVGGSFLALKGYEPEVELAQASFAIGELGGELAGVEKYILPQDNRRAIVQIRKIRPTPTEYPRKATKIVKSPLR